MLEKWNFKWTSEYSVYLDCINKYIISTIRYASGDSYEGYMKDGQRCGHGVLRSSMSQMTTYVGAWRKDRRHGYGVYSTQCKYE